MAKRARHAWKVEVCRTVAARRIARPVEPPVRVAEARAIVDYLGTGALVTWPFIATFGLRRLGQAWNGEFSILMWVSAIVALLAFAVWFPARYPFANARVAPAVLPFVTVLGLGIATTLALREHVRAAGYDSGFWRSATPNAMIMLGLLCLQFLHIFKERRQPSPHR